MLRYSPVVDNTLKTHPAVTLYNFVAAN